MYCSVLVLNNLAMSRKYDDIFAIMAAIAIVVGIALSIEENSILPLFVTYIVIRILLMITIEYNENS